MKLRPSPLLERVPLAGPVSVAVREFRQKAFRYPWHQHPEAELTWIVQGSGLRHVGDHVEPFHAGDLCLLAGNLPHAWLSPAQERGPVRSMVVQFDPARWGQTLLELPEFARIAGLLERASRGLRFSPELAARTRAKMLRRTTPLGHFTALVEILEELAGQNSAQPLAFIPSSRRRTQSDPRVRTILTFLAKNASSPIPQKDAARMVNLSPAAFSRFFRRAVGKTFRNYLGDLRLGDACRQLLETEHTISRIAYDSGFENLSTFNRAFLIARGVSPRTFRQQALSSLGQ